MQTQSINFQSAPGQLAFGESIFPAVVVNDGSVSTVDEAVSFIQANLAELEAALATSGALLFRGFPIETAETFDTFSAGGGYPNFT